MVAAVDTLTLDEVAVVQAQVLGRDQLAGLGITRHRVRAEVRARRWRLVGRAVVLHRGPLNGDARRWAAVLHAGSGAMLCAWSAAELYGLTGYERDTVHVVVRHGSRVRSLPWLRVHVSRRLNHDDRHPARLLPVVRPARAVLDAASWTRDRRAACALLLAAVQQRLVRPDDVLQVLDRSGRIRHRNALRRVLLDAEGGAHSLAEVDLGAISRRYGLPEPGRQAVRRDSSGRRRYLDGWYRRNDGRSFMSRSMERPT